MFRSWLCFALFLAASPLIRSAYAQNELAVGPQQSALVQEITAPREIVLPSALPSGNAINDRLIFTWTPPERAAGQSGPVPAVVLLHLLGTARNREMRQFATFLARRGIASATVTLPYHMKRLPPGDLPVRHFVGSNAQTVVQALNQSAADVSSVVDWLQARPEVDKTRIGVVGISLGAIVTHLSMGRDSRFNGGVAILGGGDLPDIYRRSLLGKLIVRPRVRIQPEDEAVLRQVDPLSFATQNQPRRVLMIQAARDQVIPPQDAQELWQALGRPPIRWVDTNHFGLSLAPHAVQNAALSYLQSVWNGAPLQKAPPLRVPSLKFGVLSGLDSLLTPAVTLQVFSLGARRDHLSLLHADVGITGRGPYAGIAATLNQFADLGIGRRLGGERFRPYVSLHLTF